MNSFLDDLYEAKKDLEETIKHFKSWIEEKPFDNAKDREKLESAENKLEEIENEIQLQLKKITPLATYTRGPWKINSGPAGTWVIGNDYTLCEINTFSPMSKDTIRANSNLIVAAPELYEFALVVQKVFTGPKSLPLEDIRIMCEHVIKKATGN